MRHTEREYRSSASRHLTHSNGKSRRLVARGLLTAGAHRLGTWSTVAILALLPGLLVRGLWLVWLAEPLTDTDAASLSANVAAAVTWLAVAAGGVRFFRRKRRTGRHAHRAEARAG